MALFPLHHVLALHNRMVEQDENLTHLDIVRTLIMPASTPGPFWGGV